MTIVAAGLLCAAARQTRGTRDPEPAPRVQVWPRGSWILATCVVCVTTRLVSADGRCVSETLIIS